MSGGAPLESHRGQGSPRERPSISIERLEPIRPRLLRAADAARYCGLGRSTLYEVGDFPKPIRRHETAVPLWDVRDLDAWIDRQKAESATREADGLSPERIRELARKVEARAANRTRPVREQRERPSERRPIQER